MIDHITGMLNVEKESERVPDPAELRVSSKTNVKKLAGAIYAKFKEHGYVRLRAIGDAAIGSGFRSLLIAKNYIRLCGVETKIDGAFFVVELENGENRNGSWMFLDPE